jgi:hypothetical protein
MSLPRRLIHNEYDLEEIAEEQDRPIELIERDFALVTVAAHLIDQFPGQLCFKGRFVSASRTRHSSVALRRANRICAWQHMRCAIYWRGVDSGVHRPVRPVVGHAHGDGAAEHRRCRARARTTGPGLGHPLVDTVEGSRHANMKELRVNTTRVLFAFDPARNAILLIGGDKRDRWQQFYVEMIPLADRLFDEHLTELEKEQRK